MKATEQETNPPHPKSNKYSPQFKEQAVERADNSAFARRTAILGHVIPILHELLDQERGRQSVIKYSALAIYPAGTPNS